MLCLHKNDRLRTELCTYSTFLDFPSNKMSKTDERKEIYYQSTKEIEANLYYIKYIFLAFLEIFIDCMILLQQ